VFGYDPAVPGERTLSAAWMGVGTMVTAWGLSNKGDYHQFTSRHPGIVQFCLADGSVRQLRTTMSQFVLEDLSGIRDGSAVVAP
jgi:hypothetical protein